MNKNIITNTDSYKVGMHLSYPPKTEYVYSYVESRGGNENEVVMFGLQYFIKEYLMKPITQNDLNRAKKIIEAHGDVLNVEGWQYIIDKHNGYLPVSIKALPEGTVVGNRVVMAVVVNTDPECYWLTTWIETALLRAIWYPSAVATNSRAIKKIIAENLEKTGDPNGLLFKLHDFGARGAQTYEASCLGGTAHLINFRGSDTVSAAELAMDYYEADLSEFSFSVPATEHSISSAYGPEKEVEYITNHIDQCIAHDKKIFSIVADTYNIYNFVDILGTTLKNKVMQLADVGATLVVRPDSGDPTVVPVEVIERLMKHFGYTLNEKGYKVLPSYVRVIQGDGIEKDTIIKIYENMEKLKLSGDNITFGMGGKLLGAPQRDDLKFAMKASAVTIDDKEFAIAKNPITDSGKQSKKGRFKVIIDGSDFITVQENDVNYLDHNDVMVEVFRDGYLLKEWTFAEIRDRAEI